MRVGSLFDGIGAAQQAWLPLGWKFLWTSEIDPFAIRVVEERFGTKNLGDIKRITKEMLYEQGPIDLQVGGSPCQSFSVAGRRSGMDDERGKLALRFLDIAAVAKPRWIVWENVPGVLSSKGGRDFGAFLGRLEECGYGWAYRTLDAQWFGLAQRRKRVFVVGYLGDWRRAAAVLFESGSVFGNPPSRGAGGQETSGGAPSRTRPRGEPDAVRGHLTYFPDRAAFNIGRNAKCRPRIAADGVAPSLVDRGPSSVAFTKSRRPRSDRDYETWVPGDVSPTMTCFDQGDVRSTTVVAYPEKSRTVRRRGGNAGAIGSAEVAGTLRASQGSGFRSNGTPVEGVAILPTGVRRLTPREYERLQGFPDDFTLVIIRGEPAADTPRIRALGNTMPVPVMRWIGERIQMVEAMD